MPLMRAGELPLRPPREERAGERRNSKFFPSPRSCLTGRWRKIGRSDHASRITHHASRITTVMKNKFATYVLSLSLSLSVLTALHAEEGASGHYLPGGAASFIDALPGRP